MQKLKTNYSLALIVALLLGIYYPALFAPFNSVDDSKMVNSLLNVDDFNLQQLFFPHCSGQYYRPVLYLTFLADRFVWGLQESFMHLENILLHIGTSLLVFGVMRHVAQEKQLDASWLPLVTALLFGLHPIATEPVNWVSGRTDVLAGLFVLASLLMFLKCMQRQSLLSGGIGALLLLAGCLSKETALFILPVVLLWCLLLPRELSGQVLLKTRALLFCLYLLSGSVYLIMRHNALSGGDKIIKSVISDAGNTGITYGLSDFVLIALKAVGFYFKKLIMPLPLNFGIVEISPHYLWLGLLVVCGVLYCLYRRTLVAYLLLTAFCLVSPAFILPLLKITWTPVAERYAYIASAPFIIAISLLFVRFLQPRFSTRVVTISVALLLGAAGVVTAQRNIVWQDNLTLFEDTVKKSPNFSAAKNELAIALKEHGRNEEADAILLANSGNDFQPSLLNKVRVYFNQGKLLYARKLLLQYRTEDLECLELKVKIDQLMIKDARTATEKISIDKEILTCIKKILKISGDPFDHYRIGQVQLRLGDKKAAKESFTMAWQGSLPNSHYHDAAKILAERL